MRFRFRLCLTTLVCLVSIAASSVAQQATVTRSSNLRQEPNTQSSILDVLHQGDTLTLTATVKSGGYYPVKTVDGKTGWIWAKNLTTGRRL